MQIMRLSNIRIGVLYTKNNSNCGIDNTEIVMFLSQRPKNYSIWPGIWALSSFL